jgi:hypothetical protein
MGPSIRYRCAAIFIFIFLNIFLISPLAWAGRLGDAPSWHGHSLGGNCHHTGICSTDGTLFFLYILVYVAPPME